MSRDKSSYIEVLRDLLTSNFDNKPTKDEEYAEQLMNVHAQFVNRNGKLTDLLDDFIEQRRKRVSTNNFLKKFIFWFFVGLLAVLTIAVVVFIVCNRNSDSIPSMVSLLSVSVTYLASLIAVFEIMSKYLFPIDEEKDTITMIQAVINNDVQVEELMSKAIDKKHSEVIERLKLLKQLCDESVLTDEEFNEIKRNLIENIKEE